jgi:hypothetical protein
MFSQNLQPLKVLYFQNLGGVSGFPEHFFFYSMFNRSALHYSKVESDFSLGPSQADFIEYAQSLHTSLEKRWGSEMAYSDFTHQC